MSWKIVLSRDQQKRLKQLEKKNSQYFKKFNKTIDKLLSGKGNREKLRYHDGDVERIKVDEKNRIKYLIDIDKKQYIILSVDGHYGDK